MSSSSDITLSDFFCGAGGSSTGARKALGNHGRVRLAANHWQRAIDTHQLNHPDVEHDIADLQATHPSRYPKTTICWMSPECTSHSLAKGRQRKNITQLDLWGDHKVDPAEERSRATMREVVEFTEYHRYEIVIVENVVDIRYWMPHIDTLQSAAPNAALVFVMGNHEQRIFDFMEGNAPKLRKTVERAWIDTVSYQGRVMWLGRTEEVEIGHLLVKHGDATNEHAAKSLLEAESYHVSVMSGHIHRITNYSRMGRKYAVGAITSGCLCQLNAHYLKRRPKRVWQHGTALATVDLKGTDVWFDNIAFQHVGAQLVAVSEGVVIAQPAAASAVTAQAA